MNRCRLGYRWAAPDGCFESHGPSNRKVESIIGIRAFRFPFGYVSRKYRAYPSFIRNYVERILPHFVLDGTENWVELVDDRLSGESNGSAD